MCITVVEAVERARKKKQHKKLFQIKNLRALILQMDFLVFSWISISLADKFWINFKKVVHKN